jgi:hypothetical protein
MSAAGIDEFSPQHLQDCVAFDACGITDNIVRVTNLIISGKVNENIRALLAGGKLFAIGKKDNGVRPIVIGSIWRRVAGKCASILMERSIKKFVGSTQLGLGVKSGCETAVHATRRYMNYFHSNKSQAMCLVDFENAFNHYFRQKLLDIAHKEFPAVYDYLVFLIGYHSDLVLIRGRLSDQIRSRSTTRWTILWMWFFDCVSGRFEKCCWNE